MDRNFYDNDDFEAFLKQKADQHKMYPSDRVWNNIYSSLHGRRRWMAIGFTALFCLSALFIGRQSTLSGYQQLAIQINKDPETLLSNGDKQLTTGIRPPVTTGVLNTEKVGRKKMVISGITNHSTNTVAMTVVTPAVNGTWTDKVAPRLEENETPVIENDALISNADNANAPKKSVELTASGALKTVGVKKLQAVVKDEKTSSPLELTVAKPGRLFVQFYISPMISYRRLSNETQPGYTGPVAANYTGNINKYVRHQPAPGLEAGGKLLYKLSNSLSVYAGAQLNYSRYYIDAYKYHVEKASIELKNTAQAADTVSGYTTIRNFSGYAPEQLQNQYWQLSIPLGVEIKLLGNKKLQFNVAGGVQPTFLINSDSYLISSDYKNYIESPDLARGFNVHTNFEAFISYQTGGFKWQLGPQFRSQLLSSYSNQYRVREYLTEYGIKFGITKTLK